MSEKSLKESAIDELPPGYESTELGPLPEEERAGADRELKGVLARLGLEA